MGIKGIIEAHIREGKAALQYEQWAVMMVVVNKLSEPRSKLRIFRWLRGVYWPEHGFDSFLFKEAVTEQEYLECARVEVMKLYRGMDYLYSLKDRIEKH